MSTIISAMPFIFLFLIPNLINYKEIISVETTAIFFIGSNLHFYMIIEGKYLIIILLFIEFNIMLYCRYV